MYSKLALSGILLSPLRVMSTSKMMAFSLPEFASQSFVQHALTTPERYESVLSFYFGVNYDDSDGKYKEELRNGQNLINKMSNLWFGGGPEYNKLCQSFVPVIRKAGTKQLDWIDSVDSLMAKIVLCDQLSRNAFKGTAEAFAYDEMALEMAKQMTTIALSTESSSSNLSGEVYPSYYAIIILPFMHSESKQIHMDAVKLIEHAKENSPETNDFWDLQLNFELEHKKVIDRFGRFPHRNKAKGRVSTPEELEWLADTENLPGWAKS